MTVSPIRYPRMSLDEEVMDDGQQGRGPRNYYTGFLDGFAAASNGTLPDSATSASHHGTPVRHQPRTATLNPPLSFSSNAAAQCPASNVANGWISPQLHQHHPAFNNPSAWLTATPQLSQGFRREACVYHAIPTGQSAYESPPHSGLFPAHAAASGSLSQVQPDVTHQGLMPPSTWAPEYSFTSSGEWSPTTQHPGEFEHGWERNVSCPDAKTMVEQTWAPTKADSVVNSPNGMIPYRSQPSTASPTEHAPPAKRAKSDPSVQHALPTKVFANKATQGVFRLEGTRRRSKLDDANKARTALTRKVGACHNCAKKKLRCNMSKEKFVPCARCAASPHLLTEPCCRIELIHIKLFRLGSTAVTPESLAWTMPRGLETHRLLLQDSPPTDDMTTPIRITQDLNKTSFPVTVSFFPADYGDETSYRWNENGKKMEFKMPLYYIEDMEQAGRNLFDWSRTARAEWSHLLLINSNPIVRKTFNEAERFLRASKSELVSTALAFWSATRLIERTWLITGQNLLGFPPMIGKIGPCRFNHNPEVHAIPVTPVMDTQLDELSVRRVLLPLRDRLLQLLQKTMLSERRQDYWYELYLASFVVLHNAEMVIAHAVDFARRFGITTFPKSNSETALSYAYFQACKTILVYFHFAAAGATPFTLNWEKDNHGTALSPEQKRHLRDIQLEIKRQYSDLQALKEKSMYGSEMYWTSQLFFKDWKAELRHRGEHLEFTEKDFMFS